MKGLSNNQLKLIALVCMTLDHIGMILFPGCLVLRQIGRLAMPIFGFMIAEGCAHTSNKKRYLLSLVSMAILCQLVSFVAEGTLYQCIFVTFTLSVILIFLVQKVENAPNIKNFLLLAVGVGLVWLLTEGIPQWDHKTDYDVDYGFFGVLLPVCVYVAPAGVGKLVAAGLCLAGTSYLGWQYQWLSLLSLPLLALYSGKRGVWQLKHLFYWYYPVHLAVLYLIDRFFT